MIFLFLHGWQSVPGGVKPTFLAHHGHEVRLPSVQKLRRPAAGLRVLDQRPHVGREGFQVRAVEGLTAETQFHFQAGHKVLQVHRDAPVLGKCPPALLASPAASGAGRWARLPGLVLCVALRRRGAMLRRPGEVLAQAGTAEANHETLV
jgi:hypothetical protein